MAYTKGDHVLEGNFHAILDKIEGGMLQITKKGNKNGSSNIKDPSTERFKLQMPVLHQSMCISNAGPSNLSHVSDSNRNIGISSPNSSYPNLKTWVSKVEKTYSKMNKFM